MWECSGIGPTWATECMGHMQADHYKYLAQATTDPCSSR
jgi:hypothetical protein